MIFHLFTDGACQPNPGDGGWAFIIYLSGDPLNKVVRSGFQKNTTNNRMEIMALLKGLEYVRDSALTTKVLLFSDSKYLINSISEWIYNWQKNGWKKKDNKEVLNQDLWQEMLLLLKELQVECSYVKGHSGHPENERCDQLAVAEIERNG